MTITALPTPPTRQDPSNFASRGDAFMAALPVFATEANALAVTVNADAVSAASSASTATTQAGLAQGFASTATTQAGMAQASALTAVNAPGTSATSSGSMTISIASKSFTIQTGKSLVVGMSVKVALTSSPTNWMHGDLTAYNTGTGAVTVNVTSINGSATAQAGWTLSLSAPGAGGGSYAPKYDAINDLGTVSSGTATVNIATSEYARIQAGGNITLALSGYPTTGNRWELLIDCVNFGGKTITASTINWILKNGTTTTSLSSYLTDRGLTLNTTGTNFLLLWGSDGGTTNFGKFMQ